MPPNRLIPIILVLAVAGVLLLGIIQPLVLVGSEDDTSEIIASGMYFCDMTGHLELPTTNIPLGQTIELSIATIVFEEGANPSGHPRPTNWIITDIAYYFNWYINDEIVEQSYNTEGIKSYVGTITESELGMIIPLSPSKYYDTVAVKTGDNIYAELVVSMELDSLEIDPQSLIRVSGRAGADIGETGGGSSGHFKSLYAGHPPIPDADVYLNGTGSDFSDVTDSDGAWEITAPAGDYVIEIAKTGWHKTDHALTIVNDMVYRVLYSTLLPDEEPEDEDDDGVPDDENDPADDDWDNADDDGDGIPNSEDDDVDGDGIPNEQDIDPLDASVGGIDYILIVALIGLALAGLFLTPLPIIIRIILIIIGIGGVIVYIVTLGVF